MAKPALKTIPLTKGQIIDLEIKSMAYDNAAISRYRDFVVFVERGVPGDEVKAEITTIRPNYARAKIIKIKSSKPEYRIEAPCKLFRACGGCQWQHLPYEKQLEQKDFLMKQFVSKLKLDENILQPILPSDDLWNYRNKVQYPVRTIAETGRLKAGYFEWHSNELVNIKHCPVQPEIFNEVIETIKELAEKYKIISYDSSKKTGWLRHICLRKSNAMGEILLTLVAHNDRLSKSQEFADELMKKFPALKGVCINTNTQTTNVIYGPKTSVIKGQGCITEEINNLKYRISATSFFQINITQTKNILHLIKKYASLRGDEIILDAYCGSGLIALSLAQSAKKVIGIEEIQQATEDANYSKKLNAIRNAIFINGKVENKIKEILENENPDTIILDPPRAGCNKSVLEAICANLPEKVIYVSCNPASLIRDLEILSKGGYEIKLIQPLDMFPHTYHIESVVVLERKLVKYQFPALELNLKSAG